MGNIYILSITYNSQSESSAQSGTLFRDASSGGQVTVRAGYLGLCARNGESSPWICASGASGLGLNLAQSGTNNDPLDAIGWAARFKGDVLSAGLLFGAMVLSVVAFLGFATFPGWHEEHDARTGEDVDIKPFPDRRVLKACSFLMSMASLFMLVSALWQHVAAVSAASMITSGTQGYLSGHVGSIAAVLIWLALAFVVITTIGHLIMVLSIELLDSITGN
jgi:hypothetical protein